MIKRPFCIHLYAELYILRVTQSSVCVSLALLSHYVMPNKCREPFQTENRHRIEMRACFRECDDTSQYLGCSNELKIPYSHDETNLCEVGGRDEGQGWRDG